MSKQRWAVTLTAIKDSSLYMSSVTLTLSEGRHHAHGEAMHKCLVSYPTSRGYSNHKVVIVMITDRE